MFSKIKSVCRKSVSGTGNWLGYVQDHIIEHFSSIIPTRSAPPIAMAPLKRPLPSSRKEEEISAKRALRATFITVLSLLLLGVFSYHAYWALGVVASNSYGSFLSSLVYGPGTLLANGGLSLKLVSYLNERLVDRDIDADHKKYL